jgi:hypothetical protein
MLITQAQAENLTIVSHDSAFRDSDVAASAGGEIAA